MKELRLIHFFSLIIFAVAFILLNFSCNKNNCEEPLDIKQSALLLNFKNNSGNFLYAEVNPTYNKDSLKIFDEQGSSYLLFPQLNLIPNTSSRCWEFDFGPIYNPLTDSEIFNNEICKNFIIQYKYNESDTIRTCYKAFKTKCGSEFSTLKVFHRGILLKEVKNTIVTTVTIIKN